LDNFGKMLITAEQPGLALEVLKEARQLLKTTPTSPATHRLQQKIQERLTQLDKDSLKPKQ
jgi:hypothetical protein